MKTPVPEGAHDRTLHELHNPDRSPASHNAREEVCLALVMHLSFLCFWEPVLFIRSKKRSGNQLGFWRFASEGQIAKAWMIRRMDYSGR
jgi:hypothetical protein